MECVYSCLNPNIVLLKLIVYVKTKHLTNMTMMVFGLHRDHLGKIGIDGRIFLKFF
jgi:hypothetical protein